MINGHIKEKIRVNLNGTQIDKITTHNHTKFLVKNHTNEFK